MNENRSKSKGKMLSAVAMLSLLGAAGIAGAMSTPDRSGKEVVDAVCANCHGTGKDGAPRIGDREAWAKRATLGLENLTHHAITGIRKMPAHGGQGSLTDVEVSRAVAYMVSGGTSPGPDKPYSSPKDKSGEQIVQERCRECHATGKEGAPRLGDMSAWKPRLQSGVDSLVRSAIRGHNAMPARGGLTNLSDAEMQSAVVFMVNQVALNKAK